MTVELLAATPHDPFGPRLAALVVGACSLRACVAFVTNEGVSWLRDRLAENPALDFRLVVSARWPTNLASVGKLAAEHPGRVWIHLCGFLPREVDGDVFQFHPKMVLIEGGQDQVHVVVGSHNWTGMALHGINHEVSLHAECSGTSQLALDAREFVQRAQESAEPFAAHRMSFYRAVQDKLRGGPWSQAPRLLEGAEAAAMQVLLAEAGDPQIRERDSLRLSMVLPTQHFEVQPLSFGQTIRVHVYEPGTLFAGHGRRGHPTEFAGKVVMLNSGDNREAGALLRGVDSYVDNIHLPVIHPTNRMSHLGRPGVQVLMDVKRARAYDGEVPLYLRERPTVRRTLVQVESVRQRRVDEVVTPRGPSAKSWLTSESVQGDHVRFVEARAVEENVELALATGRVYDLKEIEMLARSRRRPTDPTVPLNTQVMPAPSKEAEGASPYLFEVTHQLRPAEP